jgi:hypothetical protein
MCGADDDGPFEMKRGEKRTIEGRGVRRRLEERERGRERGSPLLLLSPSLLFPLVVLVVVSQHKTLIERAHRITHVLTRSLEATPTSNLHHPDHKKSARREREREQDNTKPKPKEQMQSLRQPAAARRPAHRAAAACRVRASAATAKSVSGTMKRLKDDKK